MLHGASRSARVRAAIVAAGLVLLGVVLVRTAWICDDAFITFRVIDNALHGHGLRWNVAERVQVYTHPLWLFTLLPVAAVAGPYAAASIAGIGLTLAFAAWVAVRVAPRPEHALLGFVAMLGSAAFVDFATSGLENPLAHVLLAAVAARAWTLPERPSVRARAELIGLAALATVGRLDHAVLVAPAVLVATLRQPRPDGARALPLGALPLVLWEAFVVLYYGFPLPNTAYAKLGTGAPVADTVRQGLAYLENVVRWDPVTPAVAVLGLVAGLTGRRSGDRAVAVGVLGWVAYVVWIGGDHMAGRFWTPAFALGMLLLVRSAPGLRATAAAAALLAILGALARNPPLASGPRLLLDKGDGNDIVDERGYFYRFTGLLAKRTVHPGVAEGSEARAAGPHAVERTMIGWFGYHAGPQVHVVDPLGLGDPLLSRVPPRAGIHRVGHWLRDLPDGYLGAALGDGEIVDPDLRSYWGDVRAVTRDPVFSASRWAAIARIAFAGRDPRVDAYCARACSRFPEVALRRRRDPFVLPDHGLGVLVSPPRPVGRVDLAATPGEYTIRLVRDGISVAEGSIAVAPDGWGAVKGPPVAIDEVRITAPGVPDPRVRGVVLERDQAPRGTEVAKEERAPWKARKVESRGSSSTGNR